MKILSQQQKRHGPAMVTAAYVEYFLRRMRVIGEGDMRRLRLIEDLTSVIVLDPHPDDNLVAGVRAGIRNAALYARRTLPSQGTPSLTTGATLSSLEVAK